MIHSSDIITITNIVNEYKAHKKRIDYDVKDLDYFIGVLLMPEMLKNATKGQSTIFWVRENLKDTEDERGQFSIKVRDFLRESEVFDDNMSLMSPLATRLWEYDYYIRWNSFGHFRIYHHTRADAPQMTDEEMEELDKRVDEKMQEKAEELWEELKHDDSPDKQYSREQLNKEVQGVVQRFVGSCPIIPMVLEEAELRNKEELIDIYIAIAKCR